ncbi:uncharacterized protein METZ01_LOCUS254254 [marine metagenome]|uniref:Uncharacterized protein n=1 Tax=marine metagenome TaxID=408172 RepID=A0A382IP27_9ZZZZ
MPVNLLIKFFEHLGKPKKANLVL